MESDGSRERQLTSSDGPIGARSPDFSPNGRRILFADDRTGNYELWIMKANGRHEVQITHTPYEEQEPVFSPNGKRIVFGANDSGDFDLYSIHLDGTHRRALTNNNADEEGAGWGVKRR